MCSTKITSRLLNWIVMCQYVEDISVDCFVFCQNFDVGTFLYVLYVILQSVELWCPQWGKFCEPDNWLPKTYPKKFLTRGPTNWRTRRSSRSKVGEAKEDHRYVALIKYHKHPESHCLRLYMQHKTTTSVGSWFIGQMEWCSQFCATTREVWVLQEVGSFHI